jgi:hypothetical protein
MTKPRPRTFEEVKTAQPPEEKAGSEKSDRFTDLVAAHIRDPDVTVIEDRDNPGHWRVAHVDGDGVRYIGPEAEWRARDYFAAFKGGTIKLVRDRPPTH